MTTSVRMTEAEMRAEIKTLIGAYKAMDKTTGRDRDSHQIVAEVAATKLVTEFAVVLHQALSTYIKANQ